jgi:MFS family permease
VSEPEEPDATNPDRRPRPRLTYSPLQARDVRLLATLRGASFLGDAVALVALYLRLAPIGHAWAIALLSIAASAPFVVLAPLAGHVVDHVPAKAFLAVAGLGQALVCLALGHWHGVAPTIVLMVMLSAIGAFVLPGYSALAPAIAGEENIARAQSLLQATQGAANVLGPVLGGLLVGWSGQSWPLYLDAASFAVGALATTALRHDRRPNAGVTLERLAAERMTAGVKFLWHDGLLRPLVLTVLFFLLSFGMVNVAEVFFATQTLHGSATAYGLIGSSFGAGSVVGALYARRIDQDLGALARSVYLAIAVVGVTAELIGFMTRIAYVYPLMAIAGVSVGIANVAAITVFTVRTPEALRGRVFAAVNAVFTGSELAATALGGLVLTLLAPRTVFQVVGVISTLTVLILGPAALRASARIHASERAS